MKIPGLGLDLLLVYFRYAILQLPLIYGPIRPQYQRYGANLYKKKINLFMWHARRSFLPCLLQLAMKGISVPTISCPLCVEFTKDVDHALFKCVYARRVWDEKARWWGVDTLCICDCDDLFTEEI